MARQEEHQSVSFHTLICSWLFPLAEPNWNPETRKLVTGRSFSWGPEQGGELGWLDLGEPVENSQHSVG